MTNRPTRLTQSGEHLGTTAYVDGLTFIVLHNRLDPDDYQDRDAIIMTRSPRLAQRSIRNALSLVLSLCAMAAASPATSFDQLSEAQALIYDTSHLANTRKGQVLEYRYTRTDATVTEAQDSATLLIKETGEGDRRDVEVEFLTGEQHMPLPPFTGYRGNPMIIAMLEHIAQGIGAETGGGVLYFRNRIRDALANESLSIESAKAVYNDTTVNTDILRFKPFTEDTYLKGNPVFRDAEFVISLSDAVPAGLLMVSITATDGNDDFSRQLALQ